MINLKVTFPLGKVDYQFEQEMLAIMRHSSNLLYASISYSKIRDGKQASKSADFVL